MKLSLLTREYPPPIYGGAGIHAAQLISQLREFIEVNVYCMGEPRDGTIVHPESQPAGVNAALRVLGADLSIVAAVADDTDVLHSHAWHVNIGGHLAGLMLDRAHVAISYSLKPHRPWEAGRLGGGYRVSFWAEKTAFEAADAAISVSTGIRKSVLASYPDLDPNRVFTVKNGINSGEFKLDNDTDVVQDSDVDLDCPMVIFVGRITHQKGLTHLVRAAQQSDPETQVVLLANAPDTPEIVVELDGTFTELQTKCNIPVVWVPEMLSRVPVRQIITHITIFACPSVYELLGIASLEAMVCETTVVVSAVGGIPEVVVGGTTGLLVSYGPARASDPKFISTFGTDFTTKVNRLTGDPTFVEKFRKAGRQCCIDEFSWE